MVPPTEPDEATEQAERDDAQQAHRADRPGSPEEDQAADEATAGLSKDDRERVREHEREMAERGAEQQGEGKIE
jgi:hypothetical protein